jgi:hypothetical protein
LFVWVIRSKEGESYRLEELTCFFNRPGVKLAVKGQKAVGKGLPKNKFRMRLISFAFTAFFLALVFCLGFMRIGEEDQADSGYQDQDEQPGIGSIFHAGLFLLLDEVR